MDEHRNDTLACIFDRWIRVESDTPTANLVFRRVDSPSRSRTPRAVVEFSEDGGVVRHTPGPADRRVAHPGRWEPCGATRVVIQWDDAEESDTILEVVACDDQTLELKVLIGGI